MSYFPKVSVMIVAYNQADLIVETLDSVVAQAYRPLEIVVADDASTDGTAAVVEAYAARYPGLIKLIANEKNLGITANHNVALAACTGELIATLGGDDVFLPGKIEAQVALFADAGVVLSYHPVEVFLHQTNETLFVTNSTSRERLHDVYDIVAKGGVPGASSIMVRRSACPAHGFDPSFATVSDWIFYAEVAMHGRVVELPGIYGRYRKHGRGASERTFELLSESLRTLEVLVERHPHDPRLIAACRAGGFRYLLGEVFRQVQKGNQNNIRSLRPLVRSYAPRRRAWIIDTGMAALSSSIVIGLVAAIAGPLRNILKRRY